MQTFMQEITSHYGIHNENAALYLVVTGIKMEVQNGCLIVKLCNCEICKCYFVSIYQL